MAVHRLALAPDIAEIPRLIDWIEQCCADSGIGGSVSSRLTLALDEAASNVIRHGFTAQLPPHRLEIDLEIDDQAVIATVIDNGRPFDPTAAGEPDIVLPAEEREPGGLGILLIRRMVDRVEYCRAGGWNRLRLEKSRG
jgi:anti-sigma regulatory factor (Ser/Thr protein kinase)